MPKDAQTQMDKHDREVRKKLEDEVLAEAASLMNGYATDPRVNGKVLFWLTGEQIEQGRMLRLLVEGQRQFRLQKDCVFVHSGKIGRVALMGQTFKMPMSVAILCAFALYVLERFFVK